MKFLLDVLERISGIPDNEFYYMEINSNMMEKYLVNIIKRYGFDNGRPILVCLNECTRYILRNFPNQQFVVF